MKTNLITWLSVFAFLLVFSSCKEHQIQTTQRFRLKKVIPANPSSGPWELYKFNGNYEYDKDNRLIQAGRFAIFYDAQGYQSKAETPGESGRRYYYGTDNTGRVISALGRDFSQYGEFTKEEYKLDYGTTNFPITIQKATGSPSAERLYTYVDLVYNEGNIVQTKTRLTYNTGYDFGNSVQTFQYDVKPNPFYGLLVGDPDSRSFSKNNVLDTNYLYAYDSNGLLTKISSALDGSLIQTLEYEAY